MIFLSIEPCVKRASNIIRDLSNFLCMCVFVENEIDHVDVDLILIYEIIELNDYIILGG